MSYRQRKQTAAYSPLGDSIASGGSSSGGVGGSGGSGGSLFGARRRNQARRLCSWCWLLGGVVALATVLLWAYTGLHPRHWLPSASVARLHRLPLNSRARCLDGSAPAVYVAPGSSDWVIYLGQDVLQWCIDEEDCWQRSRGPQGSSDNLPSYLELRGVLSTSESANPHFHSWSKAVVHACDGSGFLGHREAAYEHEGQQLYSRGYHVIWAAIDWLRRQHLNSLRPRSSRLLFVGRGASGVALMAAAPRLLREFPYNRVKFAVEGSVWPESMSGLTDSLKQMAGHHRVADIPELAACVGAVDFSWRCLLLGSLREHLADAAFFFAGSGYDPWLAKNFMHIPCAIHDCRDDEESFGRYARLRENLIEALATVDKKSAKDGVWLCSCYTAGHLLHDQLFQHVRVDGLSASDALALWYDADAEAGAGAVMRHYVDNVHPSNPTCPL